MMKTILLTGATDGIGLETAKILVKQGHRVLLHGRNAEKLKQVSAELASQGVVENYVADLSDMNAVLSLAQDIKAKHSALDVLINNAGVLKTADTVTDDGLDIRFVVNTIAPYLLTKQLLPLFDETGRILNLSSAAQAPVNIGALSGRKKNLADMDAYSQSKLAITMWSYHMAQSLPSGPAFIAVNPGSLLGSKMVKEGFGIAGHDITIGADILVRLALDEEYADVSGRYFDNDKGVFSDPHEDALDQEKVSDLVGALEGVITR